MILNYYLRLALFNYSYLLNHPYISLPLLEFNDRSRKSLPWPYCNEFKQK